MLRIRKSEDERKKGVKNGKKTYLNFINKRRCTGRFPTSIRSRTIIITIGSRRIGVVVCTIRDSLIAVVIVVGGAVIIVVRIRNV